MNPYAAHASTLAAYQAWQGADCPVISSSISGQPVNYQILPGSARLKSDMTVGGFQMDSDFMFAALVVTFGANYSAETLKSALLNTEIDYLGHAYKVKTVSIGAGGLQVHVECDDLNQGA